MSKKDLDKCNIDSVKQDLDGAKEDIELFPEKIIKKGHVIFDLKINYDENGKIKDDYEIKGIIKDAKIQFFNNYIYEKINFIEYSARIFGYTHIHIYQKIGRARFLLFFIFYCTVVNFFR